MDLPLASTADSPSLAPAPVVATRGLLRIWTVLVAYGAVALGSMATGLTLLTVELARQVATPDALVRVAD